MRGKNASKGPSRLAEIDFGGAEAAVNFNLESQTMRATRRGPPHARARVLPKHRSGRNSKKAAPLIVNVLEIIGCVCPGEIAIKKREK
jgi:hypothetical protein